jgi:hypothetical protein
MLMGFHVPSIPDFGINVKSAFIPSEVIETTLRLHKMKAKFAIDWFFLVLYGYRRWNHVSNIQDEQEEE